MNWQKWRLEIPWVWAAAFAIVALIWFFWSALSYPFQFDDYANVVFNRAIRYLEKPSLLIAAGPLGTRPLTNLTYAIDYARDGLSLSRYRSTNLAIHILNCLLFLLVARRLSRGAWIPALAGAACGLFHPLLGESVLYISARSSLLVCTFALLAMWLLLREGALVSRRARGWTLVGFIFVSALAMASKESGAIIPFLGFWLLACGLIPGRKAPLLALVPLIVGGFALLATKLEFIRSVLRGFYNVPGDMVIHGYGEWLRLEAAIWLKILRMYFDPRALAIDHALPLPPAWLSAEVLGGFFFASLFIVLGFYFRKRQPIIAFGLGWMLLALAPTNSFIPIVDPLGERHLYMSAFGIGFFMMGVTAAFEARFKSARPWRLALICLLLSVTVFHAFVSFERRKSWSTAESLWADAAKKYPGKFRISMNLAMAKVMERGDYRGAFHVLLDQLRALPYGSLPYNYQSWLLIHIANNALGITNGNYEEAAALASKAFAAESQMKFWKDLIQARLFTATQQNDNARAHLEEMLAYPWEEKLGKPAGPDRRYFENVVRLELANVLPNLKQVDQAIDHYVIVFQQSLNDELSYWVKREALGDLYMQQGRVDEALPQYEAVARQERMHKRVTVDVLRKIASLHEARGNYESASRTLQQILDFHSDDVEVQDWRASLISRSGAKREVKIKSASEAHFFEKKAPEPIDPKEIIRP